MRNILQSICPMLVLPRYVHLLAWFTCSTTIDSWAQSPRDFKCR